MGELEALYERHRDRVAFFIVYIREAHPEDGWVLEANREDGIELVDPVSLAGRAAAAEACAVRLETRIPTLLDDVFSDNRAGTYYGGTVTGISATDAVNWDLEIIDQANGATAPTALPLAGTVLDGPAPGTSVAPGSTVTTPSTPASTFVSSYDVGVDVLAVRAHPQFRVAAIVTAFLPYTLLGDYHLKTTDTTARGAGVASAAVRWGVAGDIVTAWLLTLPAAAAIGALAYGLTRIFGTGALGPVVITVLGIALAAAVFARRSRQQVPAPAA